MNRQTVFALLLGFLAVVPSGVAQQSADDCESRLALLRAENAGLRDSQREIRARLARLMHDKRTALWACNSEALQVEPTSELPEFGIADVLAELNRRVGSDRKPRIVFDRVDADTLYVSIENASYLTQRMGSTGASCFLAAATYSLTSVPKIDYVWFEFDAGDHANPGRYSRVSFPRLIPLFTEQSSR